jgi:hypothetical protein
MSTNLFGARFKDILISSVKLKLLGLFEFMMAEAPQDLKRNPDIILAILGVSVDFKNFSVLSAIIKYIEKAEVVVYGEHNNAMNFIMHFR